VIGGATALGLVVTILIVLLVYRKRQAMIRMEARREQNTFVDLEVDEDGNPDVLKSKRKTRDLGVNNSPLY